MALEQTLGIVKPNAVLDNNIGNIVAHYEKAGLRIAAKISSTIKESRRFLH